ncbi:beta-eliminating lyase-related protein [Streptomyces sp. NPDC047453]|uniref:beta-eliminating lyase-related protein n=1 Tax=Streptomyces sp. NPDC047453 TaxID=3154812 RepID=UPI0033CC1986
MSARAAQRATGIPEATWALNSQVVGDAQTVERARHVRKRLGGAMRQTGVLAAAGKVGDEDLHVVLAAIERTVRHVLRG